MIKYKVNILRMKLGMNNISNISKLEQSTAVYSPRSSLKRILEEDQELLADLTLNFDKFTINVLKVQFQQRKNSLSLLEFIKVVRQHLVSWQGDLRNRKVKIVRCLIKLFNEIDLNNNKSLEWEEFTNYIIEKATVLKSIKLKTDQIKTYTPSNLKLRDKYQFLLPKVIYVPHQDRLAFFEEAKDRVHFLNPDNAMCDKRDILVEPKRILVKVTNLKKDPDGKKQLKQKDFDIPHRTHILDILYIPDERYKVLLTSSHDKYVRGWKYTSGGYVLSAQPENQEEKMEHKFQYEVYSMGWDSTNQILYCGHENGLITKWNLKMDTEKTMQAEGTQCHNMMIMDILTMPKLQFMASGGMDGKLILWDTINNSVKWTYRVHTRGILSLAFNQNLILLFSAGFDHQICIWNPYISEIIHRMVASSSPFLTIRVIQGTNQLVTLSSDGNVRIADMKRFKFISSFCVESSDAKHKFNPQSFCYIPRPLRLSFCGRSILLYDYDKSYNPSTVDDCMAVTCRFLPSMMSFFTPTGSRVKIWNALTGDISRIYQLTQTDITAFEFDQLEKRMLIGQSSGTITIFNIMNGARLNSLPKHSSEVIGILHCQMRDSEAIFITGATDNRIIISSDNYYGQCIPIRQIFISDGAFLTTFTYCPLSKAIILGTSLGAVGYYERETGKLLGNTNQAVQYEEINSLDIITGLPFLIVCYSSGKIYVVALPPLMCKFQRVFYWVNHDHQKLGYSASVSLSKYNPSNHWLYICDDKSYIKAYNLEPLIEELQQFKVDQSDKYSNSELFTRIVSTNVKIMLKQIEVMWTLKLGNQIIKSFILVIQQGLLITCSFDKKVKIWNCHNGQYIDSLQQNYDKKEPCPIAYRKNGTQEIYHPDLETRVDKAFYRKGGKQESQLSMFDPFFMYENIMLEKLGWTTSNSQWKLNINLKKYFKQYTQKFDNTFQDLKASELKSKMNKHPKKRKVNIGYIMKVLKNETPPGKAAPPDQDDEEEVKEMTAIQPKVKFSKKEKALLESLSLDKLIENKSKKADAKTHKMKIQVLYHKETISKLERSKRTLHMSEEEALAAMRLTTALSKAMDVQHNRKYIQSIQIRKRGR